MEIVPCHASLSQRSDLKAGLLEDVCSGESTRRRQLGLAAVLRCGTRKSWTQAVAVGILSFCSPCLRR